MPEELSVVQQYFEDLWGEYLYTRKERNPSDRKFARWLGVGEA